MSDSTSNVAFVRTEQIPPSAPPVAAAGPVRWVKDNLFSGVFNTILTLVAFYVVAKFAVFVFPWFYNGVWDAASRKECLEILDGVNGACFAVLVDRWDHLVFGFKYPPEGYWRILLSFVLLLVAAAPALFASLPRKMLFFTAFYPCLLYTSPSPRDRG